MESMSIGRLFGSALSKFINKGVEKKLGFKPNINLYYMEVKTISLRSEDDTVDITLNATIPKQDFEKLIMEVTK